MIIPIRDVDIRFVPGPWPVPQTLRERVPDIWARLLTANPKIWDGRILGVSGLGRGPPRVEDGVLLGEAREDSYSSFLTWRELGSPEIGVRNLFGSAIAISSDNSVLLGKMAEWTGNAGVIYPPAGSLEPRDVVDGRVRVFESMARELTEETGLAVSEARVGRTFAIFEGPRISVARGLYFSEDSDTLLRRVRANLEAQSERELSDVIAVRTRSELETAGKFPPYVGELMEAFAAGRFEP
jgi:8-oxo-dGTP pyrophosphatase MutT (NUDIX family)